MMEPPERSSFMRRPTVVRALLMLAMVQGSAGAQPAEQRLHLRALRIGDTIRVSSNFPYHRRSVVVITHIDRDTLRVGGLEGQRLQRGGAIPITALTRMEVQRGSTGGSHWSLSGATVGLIGGVLLGGVVGRFAECGRHCPKEEYAGLEGLATGALIGGLTGGLAGGWLAGRDDRQWRRVSLVPDPPGEGRSRGDR